MKNKRLIVTGLIIFLVIVTIPLWYNLIFGEGGGAPELEYTAKAKAAKKCVESTQFMKTDHMELLYLWRESVVRDGKRTYVNSRGESFNMSLTNTCLDCHSNKDKFCDRCHEYSSVRPYCWDCHNVKEKE